ncbi:MAG TPA: DUF488 domain-containing protein [Syntrophorhabdaceae bacterium]|nr:DUF488 domain-containing protein [Syntrophorhabdaceae bacterium]
MIKVKRIYERPANDDGLRVLVDRLWPRGVSKDDARIGLWLKDIGPSAELRQWFSHDPARWKEFKRRYFNELQGRQALVSEIIKKERRGTITLLYGAKDEQFNNGLALKEYLEIKKNETGIA